MKGIFLKLLLMLISFFGLWFLIYQVDLMKLFRVEQVGQATEKKLGDYYWKFFRDTRKEITNDDVVLPIDSILRTMCKANGISRESIKLHILSNEEANAFALPGRYLIIYSGLLTSCENEAELAGVMAHELAHIQEKHVMKKLIKEAGLSVVISAAGGNNEILRSTAKMLSSSAYDRRLEKEADIKAVDYLAASGLPGDALGYFLMRLANDSDDDQFAWVSTHPQSMERGEYILKYNALKRQGKKQVLKTATWDSLQKLAASY